jgi:hypothetical protein
MAKEVPALDASMIRKTYDAGSDADKALLIKLYGKEFFVFDDIRDLVKSVEAACKLTGRDFHKEFSAELLALLSPDELAYKEWKIVAEALNEGVVMDYSNVSQKKWEIWMREVSGRGLSLLVVGCGATSTAVGPRLSFAHQHLGNYFAEQFPDILDRFFNSKNK